MYDEYDSVRFFLRFLSPSFFGLATFGFFSFFPFFGGISAGCAAGRLASALWPSDDPESDEVASGRWRFFGSSGFKKSDDPKKRQKVPKSAAFSDLRNRPQTEANPS